MKRNSFSLPNRMSSHTEHTRIVEKTEYPHLRKQDQKELFQVRTVDIERYVSRPYEQDDVLPLLLAGNWFNLDAAEFDSPSTAAFARTAQTVMDLLLLEL